MKNSVDVIVNGILINPELTKLESLKRKGFWKDHLKALLNLGTNLIGTNGVSPTLGVTEFVVNEIDILENYKLSEFFRKFTRFVMELTDVNAEERVKFSEELQKKAKDYPGNIIMGMVDRLDNINKEEVLASLVKARIHGFISIENFFRLSSILERIPFVDLIHLREYNIPYYDESGDTELLFSTGVLLLAKIDDEEGNKYVLSQLGEELIKWGLQEPVITNRPKGTSLPYSFEDADDADIENIFESSKNS